MALLNKLARQIDTNEASPTCAHPFALVASSLDSRFYDVMPKQSPRYVKSALLLQPTGSFREIPPSSKIFITRGPLPSMRIFFGDAAAADTLREARETLRCDACRAMFSVLRIVRTNELMANRICLLRQLNAHCGNGLLASCDYERSVNVPVWA
jgi:hypothetical protein